jgi:hypothetical protein
VADAFYGEAPRDLGPLQLPEWQEFLHYLYLPVRLPLNDGGRQTQDDATLPARLEFLRSAVYRAINDAIAQPHLRDPYVYVTARRGYATPGNPLNRPGWHCDDFGGTDLNYIWTDAFPTQFLRSRAPLHVSDDDAQSMEDMAWHAELADAYRDERGPVHPSIAWIEDGPVDHLLRLTPYVVHNTPEVPAPGGMRSFFKISVSTHRYNLLGNSRNHLLDYDWPMYDRAAVRNQPQGRSGDYVLEPVGASHG